jgi:hypothetical protein
LRNTGHPVDAKVKIKGLTSSLWIRPIFGVCGELWLIFGFCGLVLFYVPEFLAVRTETMRVFGRKNVEK